MFKRYLRKRNNPWELLGIAALLFVPGVVMLIQKSPIIGFHQAFASSKDPLARNTAEIISAPAAHVVGIIAITFSAVVVALYFYLRSAMPYDVEAECERDVD